MVDAPVRIVFIEFTSLTCYCYLNVKDTPNMHISRFIRKVSTTNWRSTDTKATPEIP